MRRCLEGQPLGLINALVPKRRSKILVHSRPDLEDGALAVIAGLVARGYEPIILCEGPLSSVLAPDDDLRDLITLDPGAVRLRAVQKNTLRGRIHFLTAGTVITTHTPYRPHRSPRRQRLVTIWHGECLAKTTARLAGRRPAPVSWATSMSSVGRAFRCAEFDLPPSRVLITGAPRNDRMLRADRSAIRRNVLEDESDLLILWLPTFRVGVEDGRVDGVPFDGVIPLTEREMSRLDLWLEEHHALLLAKPHPTLTATECLSHSRIRVIDQHWLTHRRVTLYTLLSSVDCLITDASTVWVDFLLTQRPLIFYFPDIEAYRATRGLNLEPYEEWVPGPLVRTLDELLVELRSVASVEDPHAEVRASAMRRFHRYADHSSTGRVLDALGLLGPGRTPRAAPSRHERGPDDAARLEQVSVTRPASPDLRSQDGVRR